MNISPSIFARLLATSRRGKVSGACQASFSEARRDLGPLSFFFMIPAVPVGGLHFFRPLISDSAQTAHSDDERKTIKEPHKTIDSKRAPHSGIRSYRCGVVHDQADARRWPSEI